MSDNIYEFNKSAKMGEHGEALVLKFLKESGLFSEVTDVSKQSVFQAQDIDAIVKSKNGVVYNVETKTDYYDTENIFFECVSNVEDGFVGCMLKTRADVLFYYVVPKGEVFMLNVRKYVCWVLMNFKDFRPSNVKNRKTDGRITNSMGLLIPKKKLLSQDFVKLIHWQTEEAR